MGGLCVSPVYQEASAVRTWHHCMLMCHLLQIGPTVGKGEYRVQAAEALVAAVRSSAAASPELVEMILQASPVSSLHHHVSMLEISALAVEACCIFPGQDPLSSSLWVLTCPFQRRAFAQKERSTRQ